MYIPSRFLYSIITSEQIGVFCESNSQGDHAIIAKLNSSTIKSISLGAKVELFVYLTKDFPYYLGLVMKIYDNQQAPMHAILAQRWKDGANVLKRSFFNRPVALVFYDETDAPVQLGTVTIKTNFRNKRLMHLLNTTTFESSNDVSEANKFMDNICVDLGLISPKIHKVKVIPFKFSTKIEGLSSILAIHANEHTTTNYDISSEIDGSRQEKQMTQSLSLLNSSRTYLSPLVKIGKKERELTDILTLVDGNRCIAVESKCLQVDPSSINKSYERLGVSIIKHAKKAIGQLEGVYKALCRGEELYDSKRNTIEYTTNMTFYGVVLIDEFRPSEHWVEILHTIKDLKQKYGIILNIISLSELTYSIKVCQSNPNLLIHSLEQRYSASVSANSINVNVINSSLPVI